MDIGLPAVARLLAWCRQQRKDMLTGTEFREPSWDILLDLYIARSSQRPVSVSSLCIAAQVPASTAVRWINLMVDRKVLLRRPDTLDKRRCLVELSADTLVKLEEYLAAVQMHLGIDLPCDPQ